MSKTSYILIGCLIVFGLIIGNKTTDGNQKDAEISDLRADKHISDSLHVYKDERLRNYFQVTLRQDSIIEVNSYTKRLKEKDSLLLDFSNKL